MASPKTVICAACGYKNPTPLPRSRCVSCGARVDKQAVSEQRKPLYGRRKRFSLVWLLSCIGILGVLTAALVVGLPMVIPVFDFEGYAGMLVALSVWTLGGTLVGLISPGQRFAEPLVAALLVAVPTALFLFTGQTVKTMPAFVYVLLSALGALFAVVGAYVGERLQLGPRPRVQRD